MIGYHSYEAVLALSKSYYQTRVNTFSVFISNITDTFPPKQYYTHFQTSNSTDIFRELLANNTANFFRFHIIIKQY